MAASSLAPTGENGAGTRAGQEAATTTKTTSKIDDGALDRHQRESISSPSPPPPSSLLRPGQRVRVRGAPATVRYVGPVVGGKDPRETWVGLEWDDASGGRGKHDGEVGGVRYFSTKRCTKDGERVEGERGPPSGSLVRASALDAPGVLVLGCSVEEALVRRYRGDGSVGDENVGEGRDDGNVSAAPPSFVAGHEEVAARLSRIHELEVASVAGSPAAFSLVESAGGRRGRREVREGGGQKATEETAVAAATPGEPSPGAGEEERVDSTKRQNREAATAPPRPPRRSPAAADADAAADASPSLVAGSVPSLVELAPRLLSLDASGCLLSEWGEVRSVLRGLPRLERLDLTRCSGLGGASAGDDEEEGEERRHDGGGGRDVSCSSFLPPLRSSPSPLPRSSPSPLPPLPAAPLHLLRELVLAETGTRWETVARSLAASGATRLRALSLRRCGLVGALRCDGEKGGVGESTPTKEKLLPASPAFSHLEEIDLSENDLRDWRSVSRELGRLPKLLTLDLSRNARLESISEEDDGRSSPSPATPRSTSEDFASLRELRLAECGISSWEELECFFRPRLSPPAPSPAATAESRVRFASLSSLRLSGNPLPIPEPTTGLGPRADVVARLRGGISVLNGATVQAWERSDASRALEAAVASRAPASSSGAGGSGRVAPGPDGARGAFHASPVASSVALPAPPMAASMIELRIVPSGDESTSEKEKRGSGSFSAPPTNAKTTAPSPFESAKPVRLPASTTVTRLRQLASRLTGVPAREQALSVEMRGGGSGGGTRGVGGGEDVGNEDDGGYTPSAVVVLELTQDDDSRDLRFLGVSNGSIVRVARR